MKLTGKDSFLNQLNRVIPPGPGQDAHYICHACGERFIRKVPVFFGFCVRCPKCGSFRVSRDPSVVY